ncbi:MAG: phosphoenolpyruvate--protein phosphotransferase [Treponema sp.]|nr:phosphoenolpyruvate--protein phosphotransferase [Treponema sp.]
MTILTGNGVSPGIAVGTIHVYSGFQIIPEKNICPPGEERSQLDRYETVKTKALDELEQIFLAMEIKDPEKAKIFRAHQDIVNDVAINEEIPDKIQNEHWTGDWAIYKIYETFLRMVKKAKDPLIAERAADFEDVRGRLLRLWHGRNNEGLSVLEKPVIIAAKELLPSDTASMDPSRVLAILTETGGLTSHSAIIAKSYGIPAVLGIQELLDNVKQNQTVVVDADKGKIYLDPEKTIVEDYTKKADAWHKEREATESFRYIDACTKDNIKIDIAVNIANADEKELEAAGYADSVGLFRTEFLYMGRNDLPGEEEQFSVYKKVLERFGKKPVILRTLDIGGDKTLQSMELPKEDNPFLGNRALRLCFTYPDIFTTQIRACLRASEYGNLWIMLPMVGSIDDIRKAKDFIFSVRDNLKKEGKSCGNFKLGIMIEIPSIALMANIAAKEVDFASIGSNDLCQYLCAADRMNGMVEPYYQSYHPAMFRLLKETIEAFSNAGKPISICGELGGDPLAVPVLIGFGIRKLSMGAASVPNVKRIISGFTVTRAEEIARKVLEFETAEKIKTYLTDKRL